MYVDETGGGVTIETVRSTSLWCRLIFRRTEIYLQHRSICLLASWHPCRCRYPNQHLASVLQCFLVDNNKSTVVQMVDFASTFTSNTA